METSGRGLCVGGRGVVSASEATQRRSCGAKVARGVRFVHGACCLFLIAVNRRVFFFFKAVCSFSFLIKFGFIKYRPRIVECFFILPLEIFFSSFVPEVQLFSFFVLQPQLLLLSALLLSLFNSDGNRLNGKYTEISTPFPRFAPAVHCWR